MYRGEKEICANGRKFHNFMKNHIIGGPRPFSTSISFRRIFLAMLSWNWPKNKLLFELVVQNFEGGTL